MEQLGGENGTPDGDGVASLAKWGATLVLLACAVYLAFSKASWWVWVGNSAFRGIREPKDIGLGIQCVFSSPVRPSLRQPRVSGGPPAPLGAAEDVSSWPPSQAPVSRPSQSSIPPR